MGGEPTNRFLSNRSLNQDRDRGAEDFGTFQHQHQQAAAAAARRASAGAAAAIVAAAVAANNAAAAAAATGTSPAQSHGSANSSLRLRQTRLASGSSPPPGPRSPYRPKDGGAGDDCGVDTLSPGETGALTPGSTFDVSEVDRCVAVLHSSSSNAANGVEASGGILDRVARELSHYNRVAAAAAKAREVDDDDDDHSRRFVLRVF